MRIRLRPLPVVLAVLASSPAVRAAEPENVVVRNRLYNPKGTLELGLDFSSAIIEGLTSTTNLQAVGAYNITNEWAVELMAGYAISSATYEATEVSAQIAKEPLTTNPTVNDFSGIWQMKWNVVAGARWAPIYGKLSLSSELAVHFQAYLALGVGATGLYRDSPVYCLQPDQQDSNNVFFCPQDLTQSRVAPLADFGGGLSFFLPYKTELKLEIRDYAFPDQYQINIDRAVASSGNPNAGTNDGNAGLENTVFMTVGLAYVLF